MILHLLNKTCTVKRRTASKDASTAAPTYSWSDLATSVPCAVQLSSSREDRVAMRESGVSVFDVYFQSGQDVRFDDRIIVDSLTLSVASTPRDDTGRGEYTRCTAVEVKGGEDQ